MKSPGPFAGSSFKPSCSWIAVKIDTPPVGLPVLANAAKAGVVTWSIANSRWRSNVPVRSVLSTMGRSKLAASVSCGQEIAGDGAFGLGMIAEYMDSLVANGAGFYRNLFWEAGLVGQVLYLEAEEAGIRATGIGCYFDDPVHEVFGILSRDWQSFYQFTVGGPVEDGRLTTLPAYSSREPG